MTRKRNPEKVAKEQRMLQALEYIRSGRSKSVYDTSVRFDVSYSTLKHHVKGRVSRQESRHPLQKLFPASELELHQGITRLTITGYSPSHPTVREMAEVIRARQEGFNTDVPTITPLGVHWVRTFIQRHPDLETVIGKTIEKARIKGTTVEALQNWFNAFETVVVKNNDVLSENVYNMDESGFSIGTINASRVIVNTQIGQRYQANPGRQEWVSVVECICMDDTSISPMIIFKGENLLSNWIPSGLTKDWAITCNTKGWTSNEHGLAWLQQVFEPRTREKAQGRPRVLICDGHDSHVTGRFIRHCMDHNIQLLILPPHSSHFTQPLDIGVFSPLKQYLSAELHTIIQTDIAHLLKGEWANGYSKARPKAFTASNIHGIWAGAGLNPFQPRKVLRRVQAESFSPHSTPPPPENVFDNALLLSSPSDMIKMHTANNTLRTLFTQNAPLHTPERNYIVRLGQKAEGLQARVTVLEQQKQQSESVLSARKAFKSGRRLSIEGKHLLMIEEVYQSVAEAEMRTVERKNKGQPRRNKAPRVADTSSANEVEVEVLDCITIEPDEP